MPLPTRIPRQSCDQWQTYSPFSRTATIYLLIAGLLLVPFLAVFPISPPLVAGQSDDEACATSSPDGGGYEVEICLSVVWTGAENTGDAKVAASIDATTGDMPEISEVEFTLAKLPSTRSFDILTDIAAPYDFTLPTDAYADGSYRLGVGVEFVDKFEAIHPELNATFANGQASEPRVTDSWKPSPGLPGNPFVVAVVGDGAGGLPAADAVADLIEGWNPNMLLYLGDVYNLGTYPEFYNYYEPTLGGLKAITNPVIGNHEAGGSGFDGFYKYWDTHQHYYSVDAAGWHFVGIDNTDTYQQREPGDPQFDWLEQDLRSHADDCTIVFMHHPRFGLTHDLDNQSMEAVWQLLAQNDVELALVGHEHNYQRWQPMNGSGEVDPDGVTQIVVGTGGHELEPFGNADPRVAAAIEKRDGALRMVLTPTGAEFQFIATDGTELDSGSIPCVVPGAVTLSESQSRTEDRVEADLTHFTPDSAITLTWEDGKLLGNGRTDAEGNARITFRTPSAAQGTYSVTAKDESGLAGTNRLSVIPRIKVTKESVQAGSRIRVYLYGYSANGTVQIRLSTTDSELYVFLGSVEVDANGRASVVVTIPESMQPGDYTLIGLPETGADGSASESIEITAPPTAPEATPV